jgi:hypothetical protein
MAEKRGGLWRGGDRNARKRKQEKGERLRDGNGRLGRSVLRPYMFVLEV